MARPDSKLSKFGRKNVPPEDAECFLRSNVQMIRNNDVDMDAVEETEDDLHSSRLGAVKLGTVYAPGPGESIQEAGPFIPGGKQAEVSRRFSRIISVHDEVSDTDANEKLDGGGELATVDRKWAFHVVGDQPLALTMVGTVARLADRLFVATVRGDGLEGVEVGMVAGVAPFSGDDDLCMLVEVENIAKEGDTFSMMLKKSE